MKRKVKRKVQRVEKPVHKRDHHTEEHPRKMIELAGTIQIERMPPAYGDRIVRLSFYPDNQTRNGAKMSGFQTFLTKEFIDAMWNQAHHAKVIAHCGVLYSQIGDAVLSLLEEYSRK